MDFLSERAKRIKLKKHIPGIQIIKNTKKIKTMGTISKPPEGNPVQFVHINRNNKVTKPTFNFLDNLLEKLGEINKETLHIRVEFNQRMLDVTTEYGAKLVAEHYKRLLNDRKLKFKIFINKFINKKRYNNYNAILLEYEKCYRDALKVAEKHWKHSNIKRYNKFTGFTEEGWAPCVIDKEDSFLPDDKPTKSETL